MLNGRRPAARDGHTGEVVFAGGSHYLLIWGGDRHNMPFNDMHVLELEREFASKNII